MSILQFTEKFNTEEKCLSYLEEMRGTNCPNCNKTEVYRYSDGKTLKCKQCRRKFTLKVGTIFEHSRVPLKKWFVAMYYMRYTSKGISSIQLGKDIGVSQQTAWFMYHRIRETYNQKPSTFTGTVETDETFVGGLEKNKHSSKKKGELVKKAVVIGVLDRENKQVKAEHIKDTKANTIKKYLYDNIQVGSLFTQMIIMLIEILNMYLIMNRLNIVMVNM